MTDYIYLMKEAEKARSFAYTPYSNFNVGAALLADSGKVYKGCNIENASFGATNCAERTAFFKAISEGEINFLAIAITGAEWEEDGVFCPPCGICRQVMTEFCTDDFEIILGNAENYQVYTLKQLMPLSFEKGNLHA